MLLLPLPLLLLLVRLNLLVLFPGALPLASAGVGGYTVYVYTLYIYISKIKQVKQLLGQPKLDRSFDLPNQLWTIPVSERNDTGQDDLLSESKAPDHANSAMGRLICSSKQ